MKPEAETEQDGVGELDLLAYADGRLDDSPARKALVEKHLSLRPALAAKLQAYARQNAEIRDAFAPAMLQPPPRRLVDAVLRKRPLIEWSVIEPRLALTAAAAAVAVFGLGWFAGGAGGAHERAAESHSLAMVLFPAGGTQTAAAAGDFVADSPIMAGAPDLSHHGLTPVSAETVTAGERQVRRIRYRDASGRSVMFMSSLPAANGTTGPRLTAFGDAGLAYWTDGDLAFGLAGSLPGAELRALAADIHRQRTPVQPAVQPAPSRPEPDRARETVVVSAPGAETPGRPQPDAEPEPQPIRGE